MADRTRPLIAQSFGLLALACLLGLLLCATACADYTHVWEYDFPVSEGSEPEAVDGEGNVYLYDDVQHQVIRVDAHGSPVEFPDLGTNVIDGHGNDDCATEPASCDQVPTNGLAGITKSPNPGFITENRYLMAVDTSGGVTDGYIYVVNTQAKPEPGRVEVFAPTGRFLGELDPTLIGPESCIAHPLCTSKGISVDSRGHIYIFTRTGEGRLFNHADQYAPVDNFPGNDVFVGQIRVNDKKGATGPGIPLSLALEGGVASTNATYLNDGGYSWRKYDPPEYQRLSGLGIPHDFDPDPGPFGEFGGTDPLSNGAYGIGLDSRTEHVYLLGFSGDIHEFDPENHPVGPAFGKAHAGERQQVIAVDPSAGPNGGRLFIRSVESDKVAVFGPPVPLPNVTYGSPENVSHTSATVTGSVELNGGGSVTGCKVEYGYPFHDPNPFSPHYTFSAPCSPVLPYAGDTSVAADLSGLLAGAEYHYRILASNENGTTEGVDQVFHTKAVLGVETKAADQITTHSARLHGGLDPDGIATTYHFDYGINTLYGHRTPEEDAGGGSGAIDLAPQEIDDLQAGRTYHYRLVATNELGASKGEDLTFTVAKKPTIGGAEASEITPTSARLSAQIDPGGYATTYHFDYGPTSAYGLRAPAAEASVGSGYGDVSVSTQLDGLEPGVTYHYRVVAENEWGTISGEDSTFSFNPPNCPNALLRQEGSANALPDCRAYEIVSPEAAGGIKLFAGSGVPDTFGFLGPVYSSLPQNSGEASRPSRFAFYGALGSIAGTHPPDTLVDLYVATRTDTGWHSTYPGIPGDQALFAAGSRCSATLEECYDYRLPDITQTENFSRDSIPYLWDVSGAYRGRLPTNAAVVPNAESSTGDVLASTDFSHFVFSSNNVPFAPGGVIGAPGSVYDNEIAAKTVAVASLLPNGSPIPQISSDKEEFLKVPTVSADGSHILISAQGVSFGSVRLYMRVDGALSYDVSKGHDVQLVGATDDGSKVLFTSKEHVTADDHDQSPDLYEWDEATDSITRLSQGNGQGNSDKCATQWEGLSCGTPVVAPGRSTDDALAVQSAGVLFYSPESLDPNKPAVPDEQNLYLANEGQVHYVATLDATSPISRVQVSPDGNHAAFLTTSSLTGYDNQGKREMYSYNAISDSLKCVSCNPSGASPANDVFASESGRFMADDGRAFFSTSDSLVKRDTNGLRDVYEFVEGRPQLISSGTSSQDSIGGSIVSLFPPATVGLEAVSHDGADVFFSTLDSLVPQDKNGQFVKFYDARTNGGFHYDAPPLPCTAADECHGGGSSAPAAPAIGSSPALGAGGNVAKVKAHKKAKKHRAKRHRKAKAKREAGR